MNRGEHEPKSTRACAEISGDQPAAGRVCQIIFQSIAPGPLTSAVLSLSEIEQMVNEMFDRNRTSLPQFEHFVA